MRIKHTVQVQISLDEEGKRKLFSDDALLSQTVIDAYDAQANSVLTIPTVTTESLSFGDVVAVKGMYLEVNQDAKVRLNGSTDAIQLRIGATGGKAKFFIEAAITGVTVENPTANTLVGFYSFWGSSS